MSRGNRTELPVIPAFTQTSVHSGFWSFRSRHCGPRLACPERMAPFVRTFTMPGVAPDPNAGWRAFEYPEPVFQLKRRGSAVVPPVLPEPAFSRTARVVSARSIAMRAIGGLL